MDSPMNVPQTPPETIPEPPHSYGAQHTDGDEARDMNVAARAKKTSPARGGITDS